MHLGCCNHRDCPKSAATSTRICHDDVMLRQGELAHSIEASSSLKHPEHDSATPHLHWGYPRGRAKRGVPLRVRSVRTRLPRLTAGALFVLAGTVCFASPIWLSDRAMPKNGHRPENGTVDCFGSLYVLCIERLNPPLGKRPFR